MPRGAPGSAGGYGAGRGDADHAREAAGGMAGAAAGGAMGMAGKAIGGLADMAGGALRGAAEMVGGGADYGRPGQSRGPAGADGPGGGPANGPGSDRPQGPPDGLGAGGGYAAGSDRDRADRNMQDARDRNLGVRGGANVGGSSGQANGAGGQSDHAGGGGGSDRGSHSSDRGNSGAAGELRARQWARQRETARESGRSDGVGQPGAPEYEVVWAGRRDGEGGGWVRRRVNNDLPGPNLRGNDGTGSVGKRLFLRDPSPFPERLFNAQGEVFHPEPPPDTWRQHRLESLARSAGEIEGAASALYDLGGDLISGVGTVVDLLWKGGVVGFDYLGLGNSVYAAKQKAALAAIKDQIVQQVQTLVDDPAAAAEAIKQSYEQRLEAADKLAAAYLGGYGDLSFFREAAKIRAQVVVELGLAVAPGVGLAGRVGKVLGKMRKPEAGAIGMALATARRAELTMEALDGLRISRSSKATIEQLEAEIAKKTAREAPEAELPPSPPGPRPPEFRKLDPAQVSFSQATVANSTSDGIPLEKLVESMQQDKKGPPIDVVIMSNGTLTSLDNRRLLAARKAGIEVEANVRQSTDPLTRDEMVRFRVGANTPEIWGDAVKFRVERQSEMKGVDKAWSQRFAEGSIYDPTISEE